jgi:hypothetical protein
MQPGKHRGSPTKNERKDILFHLHYPWGNLYIGTVQPQTNNNNKKDKSVSSQNMRNSSPLAPTLVAAAAHVSSRSVRFFPERKQLTLGQNTNSLQQVTTEFNGAVAEMWKICPSLTPC